MSSKGSDRRFMSGVIAGAGLTYLLDPDKCGRRGRVLALDKAVHAEHVSGEFLDKSVRDLQHRAYGLIAEAWARIREKDVPDDVLAQRVRARLGRAVSHLTRSRWKHIRVW